MYVCSGCEGMFVCVYVVECVGVKVCLFVCM